MDTCVYVCMREGDQKRGSFVVSLMARWGDANLWMAGPSTRSLFLGQCCLSGLGSSVRCGSVREHHPASLHLSTCFVSGEQKAPGGRLCRVWPILFCMSLRETLETLSMTSSFLAGTDHIVWNGEAIPLTSLPCLSSEPCTW